MSNGTQGAGSSLNISDIATSMSSSVSAADQRVRDAAEKAAASGSTEDTLMLQKEMQEWSVLIGIESSVIKKIGDTLSSIVQKI